MTVRSHCVWAFDAGALSSEVVFGFRLLTSQRFPGFREVGMRVGKP
jgi:hypothetical protein